MEMGFFAFALVLSIYFYDHAIGLQCLDMFRTEMT